MDNTGQQYFEFYKAKSYGASGEGKAEAAALEASDKSKVSNQSDPKTMKIMEQVVERTNLKEAMKKVLANKGSAGVDGMTVDELTRYLQEHWQKIKKELLRGTYEPKPVKRVEIPKDGGGVRELGIPVVLDRFIQQAILQVLTPLYDTGFSEQSYGFRPKRNAHQAVKAARRYIEEGYKWVVDIDLDKFFNRVNHDVLMSRLTKKISDKRLLKIIRKYLKAGIMLNGIVIMRCEGTPQGGNLSPLLSNILLDELDKEIEARGHKHVRYADDCNVYVKSKRAGERVMRSLKKFLERRLRLKVNESKSAVERPWKRTFLGFSFNMVYGKTRIVVAARTYERAKEKIRQITSRRRGISLKGIIKELNQFLSGWVAYIRIGEAKSVMKSMDEWIRRRLRCFRIKQWKKSAKTRFRELTALGVYKEAAAMFAASQKSWWVLSIAPQVSRAMNPAYFAQQGLVSLFQQYTKFQSI